MKTNKYSKLILLDPRTDILYGSFYIKGLKEKYGRHNVKFRNKPFDGLPPLGGNMRYILKENSKVLKVFIHTRDTFHIDKAQYKWCDVYGHVNINYEHYPLEKYPKQVSLFPSFGIQNFNFLETAYYSITNFLMTYNDIIKCKEFNKKTKQFDQNPYKNIIKHYRNYFKCYYYRTGLESYNKSYCVKERYVFFLSTLWYSNEWNNSDEGVNRRRANFIEVCKCLKNCNFEGGLVFDDSSSSELFKDSITPTRLNLPIWIKKTQESELVFNTPAYADCHGWKLGEYFALGKAIISTPLYNNLPEPLIHGKHIHFIPDSSKDSISNAVIQILNNSDYRKTLEKNARLYWETYCTPYKAIERLHIKSK